jgi:hypothetical protein
MSGERTAAAPADDDAPATASAPEATAAPAIASAAPATEPPATLSRFARFLRSKPGLVVVYIVFAGAYLGASGARLRRHSQYNHYVYLAEGWLHGRLALAGQPPNENDWAKVDVLKLKDGRELRGTYGSRTGGPVDRFYPLRGASETVPPEQIVSRSTIRYVSFPPLPAVLMLPFVAIYGLNFNDILFTALWAALNPVLLLLLLRDLRRRGLSKRTDVDDLWLVVMFGVGSVYYYCSVIGEVWFTAQVVCVTLGIGYAWLRGPPAVAGFPAVSARGGPRVGRLAGAAHARRLARSDAAPDSIRRALRRRDRRAALA